MATTTEEPLRRSGTSDAARRTRPLWLTLLAVSLPMFMATLDTLVMTTALPVVQHALAASVPQLSWFLNAYTLSFATLMLTAATLGDRLGRRRVMVVGIVVFMLASIGSALSTSPEMLITMRIVQGAGGAAIMPLSLSLLASSVPERLRALAIGIWGGVSGLAIAIGPVVGGAVVDGISWQAIFWINVPVALVSIPLLLTVVRESRGRRVAVDVLGTVLLGGAVLGAVWGTVHGNDDGWTSAGVLLPLVAAGAALVGYGFWARGRGHAVLPLRLFRFRGFSVANALSLLSSAGMFGATFLLIQYLEVVDGYSALQAGVHTLPWTLSPMFVAPLAGFLSGRIGVRPVLVAGLALQAVSLAWLAPLAENHASYGALVPAMVVAGIGMSLTFAPTSTLVLDGQPEDDFAVASSANSTVREFGVAVGVAVLAAVFLGQGGVVSPTGFDGAIGPALLTGAALLAAGAAVAAAAPGRRRTT